MVIYLNHHDDEAVFTFNEYHAAESLIFISSSRRRIEKMFHIVYCDED